MRCASLAFCDWRSPTELFEIATSSELSPREFLSGRKAKDHREAWVIGRAGMLVGARRACLSRRDPPDGYLEITGFGIYPVEVTELLQRGRKRGLEDFSTDFVRVTEEELREAEERNLEWLTDRIRLKIDAEAKYPERTVLLVYHNTSLYNFRPEKIRWEFELACKMRGERIVGTLILYDGQIFGGEILSQLA